VSRRESVHCASVGAGPTDMSTTAHVDTFVRDHLPPVSQWPEFLFDLPELKYPPRLNCAVELLDRHAAANPRAIAIRTAEGDWSYGRLGDLVDRLCGVLANDMRVEPGNRVLLRAGNSVMLYASWLAVARIGAVVVATMPLLRARELAPIVEKARIRHALCDVRLAAELGSLEGPDGRLRTLTWGDGELEGRLARQPSGVPAVHTAQDDPCLLAFTSGTTGQPKATVHFHRDVLAMADTFAAHLLAPRPDDVFTGTPPLAFTYGLGAELVFPLRVGAATAVLTGPTPDHLRDDIARFGATRVFTAPTAYRALLAQADRDAFRAVRSFVSAGEHLPRPTFDAWQQATGHRIIDGIGATEMIHIFISASGDDIRPGSTGRAVPGYRACVLDEDDRPAAPGTIGRLAVRGPTGCRYLADDRQLGYVRHGWNVTGDAFVADDEGYFWYQARADDMIVSSGYNIAGPEVESALLEHPDVAECAVIGVPDEQRGQLVKAYVVLRAPRTGGDLLTRELQDFVKNAIAPYKYPRRIEYVDALPRTSTGKLQRYRLRGDADT
jgi:2-aminobenzoate-CoA ligase